MDPSQITGAGAFPQTHLTLMERAAREDDPGFREAWERFFRGYWPPLYAYLRRTGSDREQSAELLQQFFVDCLEKRLLARFDAGRGRLRSFLLKCLKNSRVGAIRHDRARPDRIPMALLADDSTRAIEAVLEDKSAVDPEQAFERDWASQILNVAVAALRQRLSRDNDAVPLRILDEWVLSVERRPAEQLAEELGVAPGALYTRATRLREEIADEVRLQVRNFHRGAADSDRELEEVFRILAGQGP